MSAAFALALAVQAAAAPAAAPQARPVASDFVCEMRPGSLVEQGAPLEASEEDRAFLPASWTVEMARPELGERETDYRDSFVGTSLRASGSWGYRNGDFSGMVELVNAEFDHWTVFYSLVLGPPGEALMMSTYYRTTLENGVARTRSGRAHGYCGELITFAVQP